MSVDEASAMIGTVLDGKYRLSKEIGRGGMATIYSAVNTSIGKAVAVKILSEELAGSKTVTQRFLREARAAATVRSPNICEVYDVGTYEARPFIVMELLEGESLYDCLARQRQLSRQDAFQIAEHVARGLAKAHKQGIVHRDLKPENIFLTKDEDGQPVTKVVDFGLAKFYEADQDPSTARLTKAGALFGTPAYMSPEQAKGTEGVDHRADLWALGCIVYEMLTGRTVWDIQQGVAMILAQIATGPLPSARSYRPDLPLPFDTWFTNALAWEPDQRFQDTHSFVQGLRGALALGDGTDARSRPSLRPPPGASARSPFADDGGSEPAMVAGNDNDEAVPRHDVAVTAPRDLPGRWRWLLATGLVCLLLGGGLGSWLYLDFGGGSAYADPAEAGQEAAGINKAQDLLGDGDAPAALKALEATFKSHNGKAGRSLLAHVSAALEAPSADGCQLEGIGHPRPFDRSQDSSKPSILPTRRGLLAAWADADRPGAQIQVRTATLDDSLRRVTEPVVVTPESLHARSPTLFESQGRTGLLYWDFGGDSAGVYLRMLNSEGRAEGASQRFSTAHKSHPYYPAMVRDDQGDHWLVWVEPTRERVHDLMLQRLDPELEPLGRPIAVTGYPTPSRGKIQAARPSIAWIGGVIHIVYVLRRAAGHQILLLRVAPQLLKGNAGAQPAVTDTPPSPRDEELDRFVGQASSITQRVGKHDRPTITCDASGCTVAWDEAQHAGHLARIDSQGKVVWRRDLPADSARPGLGLGTGANLVAWFGKKRVHAGSLTEGQPLSASVVGRVSAVMRQPAPVVTAGGNNGEWFVAWRGYEAGVAEPFLARLRCP